MARNSLETLLTCTALHGVARRCTALHGVALRFEVLDLNCSDSQRDRFAQRGQGHLPRKFNEKKLCSHRLEHSLQKFFTFYTLYTSIILLLYLYSLVYIVYKQSDFSNTWP